MTEWLKLSDEQRRILIRETAYEEGIREEAVEKDWWVTLVLKALFTSKYKDYIIFKGGTSLSKCWKLIERFSEDIDIALSAEAFGMKYEENPTNSFLNKLRKAGYEFTSNDLKSELEKQFIELGVPAGALMIEAELPKDGVSYPDPETLYLVYNSLYEKNEYLPNIVKIEVSVRSLKEPNAVVKVQSIMGEIEIYPETSFNVTAVDPKRTFLEKMFLLHEEFQKPDVTKVRSQRMSRHLYDLEKMMDKDPGIQALADETLYSTIIKHRSIYTKLPGINYDSHKKETISFIPPDSIIEAYNKDYETMQEVMIYREARSFKELIRRLNVLTERFRTNELVVKKVVSEEREYPPYKFYKKGYEVKEETRSIPVDEKFSVLRLANISLSPMEVKNGFTLEIVINSPLEEKKAYHYNLSNLINVDRQPDKLFFHENKKYVEIQLPKGAKSLTVKINFLTETKEFDMILACEYA